MICTTCYGLLRGQQGRQLMRGTYEAHFDHHRSWESLTSSAGLGCCICQILLTNIASSENHGTNGSYIEALLSEVVARPGLYRLDFRTVESPPLATFLLQRIRNDNDAEFYTPTTRYTHSSEVLRLARRWIDICTGPSHATCPDTDFSPQIRHYPTRLIELPPYNWNPQSGEDGVCYLVTTRDCPIVPYCTPPQEPSVQEFDHYGNPTNGLASWPPRGQYVTLSHCWGDARFFRLIKHTKDQMEAGFSIDNLPRTFQHAIDLARRLRRDIRYIWIDALCIIQDDTNDWDAESVKMYSVYRNSFCNISATASATSAGGLYFARDPQWLWETDINLNTEGISRMAQRANGIGLESEAVVQRCRIQDASFWKRLVDGAPVNTRAWVLQERLLAPRVLHFCENQVAWECRHLDATECLPGGVSPLEVCGADVRERERLKWLLPQQYGARQLVPDLGQLSWSAHEYWKRIVERYSTTDISRARDRLVALAGIAESVSVQIGTKVKYVAGLWENWLASQLLWRVKPQYDGKIVLYKGARPVAGDDDATYIAPTFSWASIETKGEGIICAETVRERDMYISVNDIHLVPVPKKNRFGRVRPGCYIELTGMLHAIEIRWTRAGHDQYTWWLCSEGFGPAKGQTNLYLDSPGDDGLKQIGRAVSCFCLPAYRDPKGELTCLLIRLVHHEEPHSRYQRLGIAKIPSYEAEYAAELTRGLSINPAQSTTLNEAGEMGRLRRRIRHLEAEVERLRHGNVAVANDIVPPAHTAAPEPQPNGMPEAPMMMRIRLE